VGGARGERDGDARDDEDGGIRRRRGLRRLGYAGGVVAGDVADGAVTLVGGPGVAVREGDVEERDEGERDARRAPRPEEGASEPRREGGSRHRRGGYGGGNGGVKPPVRSLRRA
jgi:hypothetical protein